MVFFFKIFFNVKLTEKIDVEKYEQLKKFLCTKFLFVCLIFNLSNAFILPDLPNSASKKLQ